MSVFDVALVGAGVAGLAAAAHLRRAGRSVIILERARRIGGRALTIAEPALGGAAFDHGASWLHDADHNPLTPIAHAAGFRLIDSDEVRRWQTMIGDQPATAEELAAATRTEAHLVEILAARAAGSAPDVSLAAALDPFIEDPWLASFEAWEGPVIAAADADQLSLLDWAANRLAGRNFLVAGGLGRFVVDALGPPAGPVRLGTSVRLIAWHGDTMRLTTDAGEVAAQACIVTVSTGVLAAGTIRFDPALPAPLSQAISGLPMGLLTKVALRATDADRLDRPDWSGQAWSAVDRRLTARGEPAMVFTLWPDGRDYAVGYIGGGAAWALAGDDAAAIDFARTELGKLLGSRAARVFSGGEAVVTGWGTDPCTLGAYCYARPGHASARAQLGALGPTGRLIFAGEAVHPRLAGTVAGAYESGRDAATWLLQNMAGNPS